MRTSAGGCGMSPQCCMARAQAHRWSGAVCLKLSQLAGRFASLGSGSPSSCGCCPVRLSAAISNPASQRTLTSPPADRDASSLAHARIRARRTGDSSNPLRCAVSLRHTRGIQDRSAFVPLFLWRTMRRRLTLWRFSRSAARTRAATRGSRIRWSVERERSFIVSPRARRSSPACSMHA